MSILVHVYVCGVFGFCVQLFTCIYIFEIKYSACYFICMTISVLHLYTDILKLHRCQILIAAARDISSS